MTKLLFHSVLQAVLTFILMTPFYPAKAVQPTPLDISKWTDQMVSTALEETIHSLCGQYPQHKLCPIIGSLQERTNEQVANLVKPKREVSHVAN